MPHLPHRDSQAELLLGGDGWAAHKEHGVLFTLDATKCMFSSGNVTERGRMGRLSAAGETVVDLFAGIGYYTLPILVKAGAAKVIACEWNPHAIEALRANLDANGVSLRCEVRQGDCREAAPKGVADRVLLGLLPSSTSGWATAVAALKSRGGWLHVHENVKDSEEANWIETTVEKFAELAADAGRQWKVSKAHLERVKWYAPHVRHVVLDLHCQEVAEPMEGAVSPPTKPQLA